MARDRVAQAATLLEALTAAAPGPEGRAPAASATTGVERFVLLSIASAHYAVPETFVTELDRVPAITPVPRVPAWLRGVTSVRGDILSVVDMRLFLGLEAAAPHSTRMLVVRLLDEEFARS